MTAVVDLFGELLSVVNELRHRRLPYAVCGGLAMAIHGFPRATVDIDLLIRPENTESVLEVGRSRGFGIAARPMKFAAVEILRISKIVATDVVSLDLLLVNHDLERIWAEREVFSLPTGEITVVSRSGLVALKQLRGSPQDVADIARLEGNVE